MLEGEQDEAYAVRFRFAKCAIDGESWQVDFTGRLSTVDGFTGTWRHRAMQMYASWDAKYDTDEAHTVPTAREWSWSIEPARFVLSPLTVGTYTLRGCLFDEDNDNGFVVPAEMQITLHRGGVLTGATVGFDSDQTASRSDLTGSWTRDSSDTRQEYRFTDSPNEVFALRGPVQRHRFSGEWMVVDLKALGAWDNANRQRFEVRAVAMCRMWSPEEHRYFPDEFKRAVSLCLLWSFRSSSSHGMPCELWPRVLVYCDSLWFTP